MPPAARSVLRLGLVTLGLSLLAGCGGGVTYTKDRLVESLQELLTSEQLHGSVRFVDHTLAVYVEYPGTLAQTDGQIDIGPGFAEVSRKVTQSLHRVLLSSDAPVQFYVVLLADPAVKGAYLTIVRYVDDIRRANANMLDTPEMLARTVFDLNVVEAGPLTLEQYVPRDIQMEEFLSWQLSRRIQATLIDALQNAGLAQVGRCGAEFHNGEFAFTLNVVPAGEKALDEASVREAFQASTTLIANVLSSYQFRSFESVRLILPAMGRNIVVPKTSLEIFR